MQFGSLKVPESSATSSPETFSVLRQSAAIHDECIRTVKLTPQGYGTNSFVIGVPLQNVPGQSFSGLNTRSGDLISIRAKGMATNNTINGAGKCHVCMLNEAILEIREGSCSLLD